MIVPPVLPGRIDVSVDGAVILRVGERVKQEKGKRELGGLLLGFRDEKAIRVVRCTFPGPGDISTRTRFHRRSPSHQISASIWWARCGGRGDWVGEWHSHPEDNPSPSGIDLTSWRRQVRHTQRPMVFLIFGLRTYYCATLSPDAGIPIPFGKTGIWP